MSGASGCQGGSQIEPHRPPRHHHVHAADRGARGDLESAWAVKEAAS
jgi:hypothetical protein